MTSASRGCSACTSRPTPMTFATPAGPSRVVRARRRGARSWPTRRRERCRAPDYRAARLELVGASSRGAGIVATPGHGNSAPFGHRRSTVRPLRRRHAAPDAGRKVCHMSWQALADGVAWFFLVYFIVLGVGYFLLNLCVLLELPRQLEAGLPELLPRPHSGYEPPVSIIMPAYNEKATFASAVHSVLQLEYPEFEVIVVNDGSSDGTLEALIREFSLMRFPEAYRRRLDTRTVHGVYRSKTFPNLRVIDKANGGKADATNAGVDAARYPLVCVVDADSIL